MSSLYTCYLLSVHFIVLSYSIFKCFAQANGSLRQGSIKIKHVGKLIWCPFWLELEVKNIFVTHLLTMSQKPAVNVNNSFCRGLEKYFLQLKSICSRVHKMKLKRLDRLHKCII